MNAPDLETLKRIYPLADLTTALNQWHKDQETLATAQERKRIITEARERLNALKCPDGIKGDLNDFYRLIVKAKDSSSNESRFMDFQVAAALGDFKFSNPKDIIDEAAHARLRQQSRQQIQLLKASATLRPVWTYLASSYLAWWKDEFHRNKVKAGRARAKKAYAKKKSS